MSPVATVPECGIAAVALSCPAPATATCRGALVIDVPAPLAARATSHQTATAARGGRRINLGRRMGAAWSPLVSFSP